jgi:outer membrane protein OmpA-like peptidoglycan-associated protein
MKLYGKILLIIGFACFIFNGHTAWGEDQKAERKEKEQQQLQKEFEWWPTDAKPAPVKDPERGGYWWQPTQPGQARPWGNRGYIYVYKIIYDYQAPDEEAEEAPERPEMRSSLLIKKIIRNIKIYFDYNNADLRDDHIPILRNAVKTLQRNPEADILITGNCDARGSSEYNLKLGKKRGAAVQQFMIDQGVPEERVKIVSRGKLDAMAPISDLDGMQKDRNAQFVIAEVEEIMIPAGSFPEEQGAKIIEEGKYIVEEDEKIESAVKVSTREYVIKKNDSLWKIAAREMGNGNRWKYLYELNKERIKNPNKLKVGQVIIIPVE